MECFEIQSNISSNKSNKHFSEIAGSFHCMDLLCLNAANVQLIHGQSRQEGKSSFISSNRHSFEKEHFLISNMFRTFLEICHSYPSNIREKKYFCRMHSNYSSLVHYGWCKSCLLKKNVSSSGKIPSNCPPTFRDADQQPWCLSKRNHLKLLLFKYLTNFILHSCESNRTTSAIFVLQCKIITMSISKSLKHPDSPPLFEITLLAKY